jgi:acylphosphatase
MGWTWPWRRNRDDQAAPEGVVRHRIRYTCRVQAVGFRYTTTGVASGADVTGWVKNLADGDVLIEVQGTPDQVAKFEAELAEECDSPRTWIEAKLVSRESIEPVAGENTFGVAY